MVDRRSELIAQARSVFPDFGRLENHLAGNAETIIANAFPAAEPIWERARSVTASGLKPEVFSELDEALHDVRRRVLEYGQHAIRKIEAQGEDADLDPEEMLGLEAVILVEARPALLIQGGRITAPPAQWKVLEEVWDSVERVCRGVGRIDLVDYPLPVEYAGTGFLVADDVIMTNRHVAEAFCRRVHDGSRWDLCMEYQPCIDYLHEWGLDGAARFRITELIAVHKDKEIDLALFRVATESPDNARALKPLTVASEPGAATSGGDVYVIGYPSRREEDPESIRRIFGEYYGVKRLQPGRVMTVLSESRTLHHDCSTLGGNSGSCVVDLETGLVIGLHFRGRYGRFNKAIALWMLKEDPVLLRAGVHFD